MKQKPHWYVTHNVLEMWNATDSEVLGCRQHSGLFVQWAERLLEEGNTEQWGEKWTETFKDGKGDKKV